jgi:hypothetical protein
VPAAIPGVPADLPEDRYAEVLEERRGQDPGPDTTRDLTEEYVTEPDDAERLGIDAVDIFTGATDAARRQDERPKK